MKTTEINWNVDKMEFSARCQEVFFCCNNFDSFVYSPCTTLVFQILIHNLRRGSSCAGFLSRNSFHFASSSRRSAKFPSGLESQFVQRLQCAWAGHRPGHRKHWEILSPHCLSVQTRYCVQWWNESIALSHSLNHLSFFYNFLKISTLNL